MLLRTTIPPRRDGTVIATVGDRRYTFSAGYGCEVLWCDVDSEADANALLAIPGERFVSGDDWHEPREDSGPAVVINAPRRRGRPTRVAA